MLLGASALAESPRAESPRAESPRDASGSRPMHVIDLSHPSFAEHVDLHDSDGGVSDFVEVRIVQVDNPRRIGVLFEVSFVPDSGTPVRLGSFSLFPPDNPGRFIVATQHRVRSAGSIVVSLRTVQPIDDSTPLAIGVGSIALIRAR